MKLRKLDTGGRPGITVHGHKLATFQKSEDAFLEAMRKHGMTRSTRPTRDRRPTGGKRP